MKKNRYITLVLLIAMALLAVSCSADFGKNVYYGGISGVVKDKDSGNGVSGVKVYIYTSESERNTAYNKWEENGGIFSDEKCLYKSTTDTNGKWTVSKVVWMSKDGAWGADYDHIPVYIIYFSEDYGCWKEEKIELVSGTSNTNAIESKRENIKETSKLTINFREDNKLIGDEITFTYSYNDGYREIKKNVSTTNGQFIINNLSYVRNESGVDVVISNIKTPNGCWDTSSYSINGESVTGDITINVNEASVTTDINLNRTKYDMGESGISGRITAPRSVVMDSTGKSVEHTLDSLVVEVEINGKVDYVLAGNGNYDSENAGSFSVDFSGLAINEKVEKTTNTTITVKVFKQGTETFTGTPLGSTTLNLDSNYSGKNSVNIFIDSWT
ncbi:MAG: MSCRAMM family adhesin SdrC [Spirochaetales bacterium]|nr:MSCRAMM family adhesin SdrC [Spirochaetales bacterium]